jgi:hypothetical protein
MIGEIHKVFLNSKVLADNNLFDIKVKKNDRDIMYKMIFYLNSTLCRLFLELNGREMTGSLTVLKIQIYELKNIFVILPEISLTKIKNVIYKLSKRKINSLTIELGFNLTKPIREQQPNPLPDRKDLDDIVFDALDLSEEERKEVYWATAELVKNRLDKARSVKKK